MHAGKPIRFSAPTPYQDGVVYQTLTDKFVSAIASVSTEATSRASDDTLLNGLIVSEASTAIARAAEAKLATDLSAACRGYY
jgi:hypothetical protein